MIQPWHLNERGYLCNSIANTYTYILSVAGLTFHVTLKRNFPKCHSLNFDARGRAYQKPPCDMMMVLHYGLLADGFILNGNTWLHYQDNMVDKYDPFRRSILRVFTESGHKVFVGNSK